MVKNPPTSDPKAVAVLSPKITDIAAVLVLAVLGLAILANSMTKPPGRDEQMYCTAGVLLAQGKMIYRDFAYPSQLPCHPLLYAAVFKATNTTRYLLTGRILSVIADIIVLYCIFAIYRRIFLHRNAASTLLALSAVTLYAFNPLVNYANGYAWNHDVVIACLCVSLLLFIAADFRHKPEYTSIAIAAALLAFAAAMRITTALPQLLFFLTLLFQPAPSAKHKRKRILFFLTATALAAILPLYIILQAPHAFLLNLLSIPALYGRYLYQIGLVHDKLQLTLRSLTTFPYLLLLILTAALVLTTLLLRCRLTFSSKPKFVLTALLPAVFFAIAFIPPTMWRQYLAIPVPFLVIALAYPLRYLKDSASFPPAVFKTGTIAVTACAMFCVFARPLPLVRIAALASPESWTPIRLHKVAADIAQKTQPPKRILTLAPLYALEGGAKIYPELAAGSIVYRIADSMTPAARKLTHTIGPDTLKQLIQSQPPGAVILGVEFDFLEAPLLNLIVKPDWRRRSYPAGVVACFPPDTAKE